MRWRSRIYESGLGGSDGGKSLSFRMAEMCKVGDGWRWHLEVPEAEHLGLGRSLVTKNTVVQ